MDFELVSLVLAVLSWNKRSKGVTPPRWWLVTVVTLSVNRGPESSWIVLYCGIPIRVRSGVVVRLLCWEYTLIKLRLLVLVISTNGYNSYSNIGEVWFVEVYNNKFQFFCWYRVRTVTTVSLNEKSKDSPAFGNAWNRSHLCKILEHPQWLVLFFVVKCEPKCTVCVGVLQLLHFISEYLIPLTIRWLNLFIGTFISINSLWTSDTIWRRRSLSTLVQVMACCLTAPSH